MKPKLPRTPFILSGLLIVLLTAMASEFFSKPSFSLYSAHKEYRELYKTPWDYFLAHPEHTISYALHHGRIFSERRAWFPRILGLFAGILWLIPLIYASRRPTKTKPVWLRNLLRLIFLGMIMGIVFGSLCGGGVHLYLHTLDRIPNLTKEMEWGGVYVGLVFGGGAGVVLGLLGGWQMWVVQLAALSGLKLKPSSSSP
jgi:Na+-driven multidrug efflux pump